MHGSSLTAAYHGLGFAGLMLAEAALVLLLVGWVLLAVFVIAGLVTGLIFLLLPLGIMGGLLGALIVFGRFAQSAQYATIEGQPGAAAAILQSMRGGWSVSPAVAANRNSSVAPFGPRRRNRSSLRMRFK